MGYLGFGLDQSVIVTKKPTVSDKKITGVSDATIHPP
jgi:hypothetical protein